jgi:uncharacterized protein YjiS (DUF1127 family)
MARAFAAESIPARRSARQGWLNRVLTMIAVGRSRRKLAALDDHLLRDIGLTRAEAQTEGQRPAWDAPAGWRV